MTVECVPSTIRIQESRKRTDIRFHQVIHQILETYLIQYHTYLYKNK